MNIASRTYKSRWGFHPCNYELFLKLKRLHAWYWQTVYDFHRWHRWWRKEPQNRVGAEPTFSTVFVEDKIWFKPVSVRGENGFKVYPKTVLDRGIVQLYHAARLPEPEPVAPFDAETKEMIETLYSQIAANSHK